MRVLLHVLGLLVALSLGCRCNRSSGPSASPAAYGEGRTTGAPGVVIPLGGPGRLGYLAFTDDGGFVAEERPLQESAATIVHLFDAAGKQRGAVTVHRAAMRLSRDGKVLGTASVRRELALWDAHDGRLLGRWTAVRPLRDVFFSPDGSQVAELDELGGVRIREVPSGKPLARLTDGEVETPNFDWSADGRTLVLGRTFGQRVWDLSTATAERSEGEDAGDEPRVSPDGRFILSARPNNGGVVLTDRRSKHAATVTEGSFHLFSPDGSKLVAETGTYGLAVIEPETRARVAELKGACRRITSAAFSPDGTQLLAASEDGSARLWEVASGRELAGWHLPPDCAPSFNPTITAVAFGDDGRTLLLGFYEKKIERITLPPALASAAKVKTAPPAAIVPPRPASSARAPVFGEVVTTLDAFTHIRFSPGSTAADWTLAVTEGDGTARLIRGRAGEEPEEIATLGSAGDVPATQLAWSANGEVLAVGDHRGRVQLVEVASRKVLAKMLAAGDALTALAVSPDGAFVAAAPRGTRIHVWKRDGSPVRELEGHTPAPGGGGANPEITSLAFASDGKSLFSASNDFRNDSHGDLRRWDVTTGAREQLATGEYLAGLSLSRDGAQLAVGQGKSIVVRDARAPAERRTLVGHPGRVRATAFLPDGRTLASVDEDTPVVRLWDLASGKELAKLEGDGQRCSDADLSISADGKLAAASFRCAGAPVRIFALAGLPGGMRAPTPPPPRKR